MKKHLLFTTGLLALALVSIQPTYAKTFYKWKDENGVTHYSSQKPHKTEAESVEIRGGRQTSVAAEEKPSNQSTPETAKNSPNPTNNQEEASTQQKRLNPERCAHAQENLETLNTYDRLRMRNEETGEMRYLEEAEKQAQIERYQKIVEEACP